MARAVNNATFGMATGVTVFAIVVPLIHLLAELVSLAGVELGAWDNPVEVFIFLITSLLLGVFPWGLWIILTDARKGEMFDRDHEFVEYLLPALAVFLTLTLLACTRLQPVYANHRWLLTPMLAVCALLLLRWRWRRVWMVPRGIGIRGALDQAL